MTYPVPAKQVEILYEIKKSKFIACAGFANSRESAMALLDSVKQQYPDARHHCWAYVLATLTRQVARRWLMTASLVALPVNLY